MTKPPKQAQVHDVKVLLLKPILRMDEAAAVLHIHQNTVRTWCDDKKLICVRTAGNQRRIRTESIIKFL